ncbi:MAG: superoxide dismutase [Chitinophagales bacterium]
MKNQKASRRNFIKKGALTVAGMGLFNSLRLQAFELQNVNLENTKLPGGAFTLPPLGYDFGALEPHIDAITMQIHHDKHHQTYVTKLNEAIEKVSELKEKSLDELIMNINTIPESVRTAIRNHGGGHWNHSFFWKMMSPNAANSVTSDTFRNAMIAKWNDLDTFKAEFQKNALGLFGSGWTWLVKDVSGNLSIVNTANQDNPMMDIGAQRGKPLMGVDVWEHAYYLKHQNKRADYLNSIWNVIDWGMVSKWYNEK